MLLHIRRSADDRGDAERRAQENFLRFPQLAMNAIQENESAGVACLHGGGGGGRGEEVFTCPFHPPVNINGEEGNHCHSSRCSTKPPDCILDSDMLFFS